MSSEAAHSTVSIDVDSGSIIGDLTVPGKARGIVAFAHGSGSSRHSTRNQQVAKRLNGAGFATLLMDLLTEQEDEIDARTRELRFDIDLLADRVALAVDWLRQDKRGKEVALEIVPDATHLFEQPGALEQVADLATRHFDRTLR